MFAPTGPGSLACAACVASLSACAFASEPVTTTRPAREAAAQHSDAAGAGAPDAATALPAAPAAPAPGSEGSARYRQVREIFARSCAYQRCHAGPVVGGGLSLAAGSDYRAALVDVEACGYERMMLVEPSHPERSWLMVKLTAEARPLDDPYATYIHFEPPDDWDPRVRRCPDQTDDGTPLFGQRMPATAPNLLPPDQIEIIRAWIAEGAPR